jgi:hypothetical protein
MNWIAQHRLINQQLYKPSFKSPVEVVKYFCCMQAQDLYHAKWAVGVRLPGSTEDDIDRAIAKGEIIRSWPLRGTLHFLASDDYHWLFDLTASRMMSAANSYKRILGFDKSFFNKTKNIIAKVLEGGHQLTRNELRSRLAEHGVKTVDNQLSHILQNAAVEKLICFGVMREKQFTFTLTDEWIRHKSRMTREEAIAELAKRYFTSRGPASVKDFSWWSGLTLTNARAAIESVKSQFTEEKINGVSCWLPGNNINKLTEKKVYLLPAFDEYLISYKDRSAVMDPLFKDRLIFVNGVFFPHIVIDGVVLGKWKRIISNNEVTIRLEPFIKLKKVQADRIKREALAFGRFLNKKVKLEWTSEY